MSKRLPGAAAQRKKNYQSRYQIAQEKRRKDSKLASGNLAKHANQCEKQGRGRGHGKSIGTI